MMRWGVEFVKDEDGCDSLEAYGMLGEPYAPEDVGDKWISRAAFKMGLEAESVEAAVAAAVPVLRPLVEARWAEYQADVWTEEDITQARQGAKEIGTLFGVEMGDNDEAEA